MGKGLLGKKLGMSQVFAEDGSVIPVTVIQAGPCVVMGIRTVEKNGYEALQLGFGTRKRSRAGKAESGVARAAGTEPKRIVREIRQPVAGYDVGDVLDLSILSDVRHVDVTGTSKGKGFAGVVKRWGFKGYPASHGAKLHRGGGSIGQASDPSRVFKGMRMAGQMGSKRRTVKRLKVVRANKDKGLLVVKGAIPGPNGSYVVIRVLDGEARK